MIQELQEKKVFDPSGSDSVEDRQMIGGCSTGIANLNSVKYQWASRLYKIMLGNFWVPEKVSLVEDKVTLKELSEDEMYAFKNTLSFLIALDSMQVNNLPRLSAYITAPEVSALYTVQEFQELIHSQSYQYILQELFPNIDREDIYNFWKTNPLLLKRNTFIANKYQEFLDDKTKENFKKALIADFALEGIYFYNGFEYFYLLASRNKVVGVAQLIRYIQNDEVTHTSFMAYQIRELFDMNNPSDVELIKNTLTEACEQEIEWSHEIYGDKILGKSKESSEQFIKYIGNQRSKLLGTGVIFKGFNENPYQFLESDRRENFFESSAVTEYSTSTAVSGWDDF